MIMLCIFWTTNNSYGSRKCLPPETKYYESLLSLILSDIKIQTKIHYRQFYIVYFEETEFQFLTIQWYFATRKLFFDTVLYKNSNWTYTEYFPSPAHKN